MHFYPTHWVVVGLSLTLRSLYPWRYSFITRWIEVHIFVKSSCVCLVTCLWPTSFPNFTFHCPAGYSHREAMFMWSHFSYFTLYSNIATNNFLTFTRSITVHNPNARVVIYFIFANVASAASVAVDVVSLLPLVSLVSLLMLMSLLPLVSLLSLCF